MVALAHREWPCYAGVVTVFVATLLCLAQEHILQSCPGLMLTRLVPRVSHARAPTKESKYFRCVLTVLGCLLFFLSSVNGLRFSNYNKWHA